MGSLNKDIKNVIANFPNLEYFTSKNKSNWLIGNIDIFDKKGEIYFDTFKIKILIPKNYPFGFPTLYEIGDKIPKIEERHIYTEDNSCCVCPLPEISRESSKGISILDYINKYAVPYLANQIYYENSKNWANGEYKHGFEGTLQYYKEFFKSDEIDFIENELNNFIKIKQNRNENCFCNSGKKFKKCHLEVFNALSNLTTNRIIKDLENLKLYKSIGSINN